MDAGVHMAVGAAIGATCIRPATRLWQAPEPLSRANSLKFFGLILLVDVLAIASHFVCDSFSHTEYWQMGSLKYIMVLIDLAVFIWLVVDFLADFSLPDPVRACVASGIFWACVPDGIWGVSRIFPDQLLPLPIRQFIGFHQMVHAPQPGWGLLNQAMILIVALMITYVMTDRRRV